MRIQTKYSLSLFLALVAILSQAQIVISPKIPEKIIHTLDSLFPGEKNVAWVKKLGMYKADFLLNQFNVSITFDRNSKVIKCAEEIDASQLPEKIAPSILKACEGYKIFFIVQQYNRGRVSYEVEIMRGGMLYIVDFNEMGYMVDKSTVYKNSLYYNVID